MMAYLKEGLFLFAVACALTVVMALWGVYIATHPFKFDSGLTPSSFAVKYDDVTLTTSDGIKLSAWFVPSKIKTKKTILLLHGYGAEKGDLLPSRIFLRDKFNLMFIDFRYFGDSGGEMTTAGWREVNDVAAAVKYLEDNGYGPIGVWGISMGAATALMAAKQLPEVKAVVAESSYATLSMMAADYYPIPGVNRIIAYLMSYFGNWIYGIDIAAVSPADAASHLQIPILLMHSASDRVVPIKHDDVLREALKGNPNAEYVQSATLRHGGLTAEHQQRIQAFFDKSL